MPHPSFLCNEWYHTPLSSRQQKSAKFPSVFNLVQSALSDSPGSFHQNAAKHQKLDANRLKDLCVFFRSHWSNSFFHLTFKLNKVSPSLFLRTFYEETCCTLQISGIWGLYVQFLLETNNALVLRIWRASIINDSSTGIEIVNPSIWIKRYNKYLANLIFFGPYCKLRYFVFYGPRP